MGSSQAIARLQPISWLVLGVVYLSFDQGRAPDVSAARLVLRATVWSGLGWAVSSGLLRWVVPRVRSVPIAVTAAVLASVLGGALWLGAFNLLDGVFQLEPGWVGLFEGPQEAFYGEWMDCTLMLLVWHGAAFGLTAQHRSALERERALRLERAASEAQLVALRAQLHPHFLFNALNAAMALVHDDAARAEDVLQRLADLLRASLATEQTRVPLRTELQRVRDYLEIERVRFEERLHVRWSIDDGLAPHLVPGGILLPLVDNAVKHSPGAIDIEVGARSEGSHLALWVANAGSLGDSTEPGLGLGLSNVNARLAAEFGPDGGLTLSSDEGRVVARVRMPLHVEASS